VPVLQEGNEVYFKIKRSTPLRKLMDAYCQRQAKSSDSIRFLYDGARVMPDSTPEEVHRPYNHTIDSNPSHLSLVQMEMEDNDIIDAGTIFATHFLPSRLA
jgi:small ubiquitin-related modifier